MTDRNKENTDAAPMSAEQWRLQAISRSNCYALLALVFRDVLTPEVVAQFRSPSLSKSLGQFDSNVAQELAGDLESVAEHLRGRYTQTFIGPGPHVSLYASVHVSDERRLWGDSTIWVKKFIETTGLSISNDWDSIPDHIAIELELMQRLTDYEAKLWGSYLLPETENTDKQLSQCLRVQEQFLREHLCAWIPQFCERVLQSSTSPFYREMAALTKSLVLSDAEEVKAVQTVLSCDSVATCDRHNSLLQ